MRRIKELSAPATPSRSCSRSGRSGRRPRRRSTLYRALRRVNPSPYLFLLELGELALVGSSPETLVKCEDGRASLNPIAGTTQPGEGDAERLLASEKDRAEHVMLVDLGRNDLSRVCAPGTRPRRALPRAGALLARHAPRLRGRPASSRADMHAVRPPARTASRPAPSRARPKVRAMQIISELEGYRRGPYAGAVGYALPGGSMDTCIAIRTIVLAGGVARLQAGAGIVADSDPAAEHQECLNKLAALEAAIELAEEEFVLLVIDNYDSFTYNLVHLFQELGAEVQVFRNDAITVEEAEALAADAPARLPRPRPPGERRRLGRADPHASGRASPRSASASATRRSSRPSAARSGRRRRCCTARRRPSSTTAAASSQGCRRRSTPAATTRWRPCGSPTSSRSPPVPPTAR